MAMESPRNVTATGPRIEGWTVYQGQEWWEAVCDRDDTLVVRHLNPDRLAEVCAAISQPPLVRHHTKHVRGPGGGFV